jgi:opacity protein-like surface antigen
MKKIFLSLIIIAGLMKTPATAQENAYALQYTMAFTMGDFNDFIGQACFRGFTFDYRKMLKDNSIGVGFEAGWSAFYEEMDYATYTDGTASISGNQWRYCSTVPLLANANYYFKPGEKINPFGGIGIGTMYSSSELDMATYAFTTDTWHFVVKPELGVIINMNPGMGLIISGKYYSAFETEESDSRSYIAANVGFAWGF